MPSNPDAGARIARQMDWKAWLALAWAAWFGVLYARMVLEERAPSVLHRIERAADSIRTSYK